jgi:D-glycero-alpha-D-manno-heptose 1-phosphate guanylyltransferase
MLSGTYSRRASKSLSSRLGYKHEVIEEFLNNEFPTIHYECSIEQDPLGTGGAIYLACKRAKDNNIIVVNGDTLFKADLKKAFLFHTANNADCTLLLKPMEEL